VLRAFMRISGTRNDEKRQSDNATMHNRWTMQSSVARFDFVLLIRAAVRFHCQELGKKMRKQSKSISKVSKIRPAYYSSDDIIMQRTPKTNDQLRWTTRGMSKRAHPASHFGTQILARAQIATVTGLLLLLYVYTITRFILPRVSVVLLRNG